MKLGDDGAGLKGGRQADLVSSTDRNFRPIDTSTGPDGALYVVDWHNPLVGHLQSHLRDSNRDHAHGRIYRIAATGRPLASQPAIADEPIPALVGLLARRETHLRTLAKIELGRHDSAAVVAAVKAWVAGLDPAAPDRAHPHAEALWVHQWHNIVDTALLARQLRSPAANARVAAVRVLCYWRDRVPAALALTPDDRDARDRAFVPKSTDILAATRLLETGQSETLRLSAAAFRTEGEYEYVCTFPGHWTVMWGKLIVTKDIDTYLKAHPLTVASAAPATHNHRSDFRP